MIRESVKQAALRLARSWLERRSPGGRAYKSWEDEPPGAEPSETTEPSPGWQMEIEAYRQLFPTLSPTHDGRYVVIHRNRMVGLFDTAEEALAAPPGSDKTFICRIPHGGPAK